MLKDAKNRLSNRKGFTLIELIVVIAIIAILAAVLIPRFTGFTENARQKAAVSDTRNILLAVEALLANGDNSITAADIEGYTGKTFGVNGFKGSIPSASYPLTSDSFTYVYVDGKTYTVGVNSGEIDTVFNDSLPASGNQSTSA